MGFAEEFASRLGAAGIEIDAGSVPSADALESGLSAVSDWFWADDLDPLIREGFDEGSAEYAICYHLADGEIGVGAGIEPLLEAFDQTSGQSFSVMLAASQSA
ncbi:MULTISPECIES: hypothetical protein [unclassified Kribbella]|uniref:hypothetical protein n=1 Tax=unclassified Kribbella TaxID=2644121 RepID=UPI00301AF8C5